MRPTPLPFQISERLVYEAEFTRAVLRGINVAEFSFVVEEQPARLSAPSASPQTNSTTTTPLAQASQVTSRRDLVFKCEAVSKGLFSKLFNLDFRFAIESIVADESFHVRRTIKHDEQGKRLRTSEAVFDIPARRVVWTELDPKQPAKPPRVVETAFGNSTEAIQDLASVFYYLRTRPLTSGSTFDLALSDSGRIYRVPVTIKSSKKRLDTVLGKQNAIELDINLFGADRPVEGKGEMTIWFADDARRTPLLARIKNEYGTLTIKLKRAKS